MIDQQVDVLKQTNRRTASKKMFRQTIKRAGQGKTPTDQRIVTLKEILEKTKKWTAFKEILRPTDGLRAKRCSGGLADSLLRDTQTDQQMHSRQRDTVIDQQMQRDNHTD